LGKIIRTGANYIIAVTEDNMMFKSWIKDITEKFTEVSVCLQIKEKLEQML